MEINVEMKFIELRLKLLSSAEGQSWEHLVQSPFIPPDEVIAWHGGENIDHESNSDDSSSNDDLVFYDDPGEAIRHTDEICLDVKDGPISSVDRLNLYRTKGVIARQYEEHSLNHTKEDDKDHKRWRAFVDDCLIEENGYYRAKGHMKKTLPRLYKCPYFNCNKILASIRGLKSHLQFHYKKTLIKPLVEESTDQS